MEVESLPDVFSSAIGSVTVLDPPEDAVRMPMFIAMDRPKHTEQRRTVAPAFTPSEVQRMAVDVRKRTAELLDSLPVGETFDWVDRVSIELTTQMLAILFDFPWEERRKLVFWSDIASDISIPPNEEARQERLNHLFACAGAFKELWDARIDKEPTPDLISMMIHSDAMSNMDEYEFLGNLMLLIVGGNDTTRNSMSAYAYGLDRFPGERARLEADPGLIPGAIQEVIRWHTPVTHMRRTAVKDYELAGKQMREGDKVVMWYISANHDETVFENPERIILDRANARRHLAFGHGVHRCVGARLGELQIGVLMEEMAKRRLRPNVNGPVEFTDSCFIHGVRSLPVELSRY